MSYLVSNGFTNKGFVEKEFYRDGAPCIIDGVDLLDILCPVSKKTGLRENPLSLIRKLAADPAKQALLYQCLQELPVDNSQAGLTDDMKFEMTPQRLMVGTPAEQESLLESWSQIVDHHISSLEAQKAVQAQVEGNKPGKISFEGANEGE